MVRPCDTRGFADPRSCGLASMYPASDWSVLCSEPSWISARLLQRRLAICFFGRHFLRVAAGLAPALINLLFDPTAQKEDGKNKWHADENDTPFGHPTHHPH